jgi:hypothetical protein
MTGLSRAALDQERALDALALMRREGLSLVEAMARAGTNLSSMLRHAGRGLRREGDTFVATERDDIPRRMTHLDEDGPRWVTLRDSRDASRLATYHTDVKAFLATGDASRVLRWKGQSIQTDEGALPLVTDLDNLEELAFGGEMEYDVYLRGR